MKIYTDGSCHPNPNGNGGWSIVVVKDEELFYHCVGKGKNTTNNRMEMTAVIEALRFSLSNEVSEIYTDSNYTVRVYNEWMDKWHRYNQVSLRSNPDLINQLVELKRKTNVPVKWIKAHNKHKWNEMADQLAGKARVE